MQQQPKTQGREKCPPKGYTFESKESRKQSIEALAIDQAL